MPRQTSKPKPSFDLHRLGITILDAMEDDLLYGRFFKGESWGPWKSFISAAFGLGLRDPEIFTKHTKRTKPPEGCREAWMCIGRRGGKLLALDTPIPTPHGFAPIGEIEVGATVFDEAGHPTKVTAVFDAMPERAYRMTFADGSTIDAGGEHQWVTWEHRDRKEYCRPGVTEPLPANWPTWTLPEIDPVSPDIVREALAMIDGGLSVRATAERLGVDRQVLTARLRGKRRARRASPIGPKVRTTDEIVASLRYNARGNLNHSIPLAGPLQIAERELPLDPYVLGLWLGDGSSAEAAVTGDHRNGDLEWYESAFAAAGFTPKRRKCQKTSGIRDGFLTKLRAMGLLGDKHVPEVYLWASADQRLALLAGLMDSDGYCAGADVEFTSVRRGLADAVVLLARSLGQKPVLSTGRAMLNGRYIGPKYRVLWSPTIQIFRLPRKAARWKPSKTRTMARRMRMIESCEPIAPKPMRCIQVDSPNSMYLCGEAMIPTHNSRIVALIAVVLACLRDYSGLFALGEEGKLMVIGADRKGARVLFRYIRAMIKAVPLLERMVMSETRESIELSNGVSIEVQTASFRSVRGYTLVGALCDEIAFWRDENSANPDTEILNAIKPGMGTVPGAILLCLSSPYARRGAMWEAYEQHFGKNDSPVLFWQAATLEMNPGFPKDIVDAAYEEDKSSARAEYGGEFRDDVESYVPPSIIRDATVVGRTSLPFVAGHNYQAFIDPSGGSEDSYAVGIGHREGEKSIIDKIVEYTTPFDPLIKTGEAAAVIKSYGIRTVTGDHYAGEWPKSEFKKHGVAYEQCPQSKSDIYRETLPVLMGGKAELIDLKRLRVQYASLERRPTPSGREVIDHPKGTHDDVANVAAGVLWKLRTIERVRPTW